MRTTVIGSYPLRYADLGEQAVVQAVEEQIAAGVTLVSDGQTRGDMISIYAAMLEGTRVEGHEFRIEAPVRFRDCTALIEDFRLAAATAGDRAEVKAILTGPVTLAFSSQISDAVYDGYRDPRLYRDLAEALRDIALRLKDMGATHFQIDEPFLSVGAPMDLAREAVERVTTDLGGEVALHVCGDVRQVFDELLTWQGIAILSHAFAGIPENLSVVERSKLEQAGKKLGFGCINTATDRIESVAEVTATLRRGIECVGSEHMIAHPDCGMRSLPHAVAQAKLRAMGQAVAALQA